MTSRGYAGAALVGLALLAASPAFAQNASNESGAPQESARPDDGGELEGADVGVTTLVVLLVLAVIVVGLVVALAARRP